jgi:hypothetical protein
MYTSHEGYSLFIFSANLEWLVKLTHNHLKTYITKKFRDITEVVASQKVDK